MATLYASFATPGDAERAAGALLDHGALSADISILSNEGWMPAQSSAEADAKTGVSITTASDAAIGMVKGSVVGLGIGALAALAAITVPGVGVVIGGGALATAMGAALGSTAAGAAAGSVFGLLKDQGIGENYATKYSDAIRAGGSLLSVTVPSGDVSDTKAEQILAKYGATDISIGGETETLEAHAVTVPIEVVESEPASLTTMASVPTTPGAVAAVVNAPDVQPIRSDPITGAMIEGVAVDPVTGVERPVAVESGVAVYSDVAGFTIDDVTPTEFDERGLATAGTIIDPTTGENRRVRIVNGSIIYADSPPRT